MLFELVEVKASAEQDRLVDAMKAFCEKKPRSYKTVLTRLLDTENDPDPSGQRFTRARLYNAANHKSSMPEWLPGLFDRTFGPEWRNSKKDAGAKPGDNTKAENSRHNSPKSADNGSHPVGHRSPKEVPLMPSMTDIKIKTPGEAPGWRNAPVPDLFDFETPMQPVETEAYRPWLRPGDGVCSLPNVVAIPGHVYAVTDTRKGDSFYAAMLEVAGQTVWMDYDGQTYPFESLNNDGAIVLTIPKYTPRRYAGTFNIDGLEVGVQVVWPKQKIPT